MFYGLSFLQPLKKVAVAVGGDGPSPLLSYILYFRLSIVVNHSLVLCNTCTGVYSFAHQLFCTVARRRTERGRSVHKRMCDESHPARHSSCDKSFTTTLSMLSITSMQSTLHDCLWVLLSEAESCRDALDTGCQLKSVVRDSL